MTSLLFNYFSRGIENHQITFSQFLYFIYDLQNHKNALLYKVLAEKSEGAIELDLAVLMRHYV